MDWIDFLRWLHILGACILIGTGAGIAFFMLMAHRTSSPTFVFHTASIVVIADMIFTASAVILQPVTGVLLAGQAGWELSEGWIVLAIILYIIIGMFWLPVVFIQMEMKKEAAFAVQNDCGLSGRYHRLFKIWFACGVPAFFSILVIVWLMVARPSISLWYV